MYKPSFPGTYYFNEFTFTTLGRTGALGPTTDQGYSEATWPSSSFSIQNGIQNWIVPESATYQITAGGAWAGNPGRVVRGLVFLSEGSVLNMLVGQQPTPLTANVQDNVTVGGGGGTFVVANGTPLIVASGGDPSHAGDFLPSGTGGGFSGAGYYGNGYPTDPVFAFLFPTAYVNGGYGNKHFYGPSGITEEGGFGGGQAPIDVTVISEFTSGAGGYTGSPGDGTAGATCYADSSVQNFTDLGAISNAAGFVNVSLVVPPPIQQISTWDENWVVHPSPFPYQTTWSAVTYGNGTYVAVSKNGTYPVTYSADGINWVKDTNGASTAPWLSVTFGNEQFAAVSSNGLSMVSTNGVEWTVRAPPNLNGTWSDVGYGNGLFIAFNGSLTSTSPDGIDWTARVVPSGQWTSVAYGNGIFVAVGFYGPPSVMTSPDGIIWTAQTAPAVDWISVTYGNGIFVAVCAYLEPSVMTSPDGINWTAQTAPTGFWSSITYGNGLFVATTKWADPDIMVSTDGINWVDSYFQYYPGTQLVSIVYGNGLFVTVNYVGYPGILTSPDGIDWTPQTAPYYGESITYGTPGGNPIFVVVGQYSTIYTSSDTITWTSRTSPSGDWKSVTYGDGIFVATGSSGSIISYDGINWKYPVKEFSSITYGNGRFIATALPPSIHGAFYSTNGLVWNSPTVGVESDNWSAVTYGQGTFVAVSNQGTTGNVMYSTDGSTWSNVTTGTTQKSWTAIAYGDGQFMAIAPWDDDTTSDVMISSDGINWINGYPINFTSNCISYGNGYFAVASSNSSVANVALTTAETIVWQYSSVPAASYTGITYGLTGFVAVSSTSFALGFNPTIWVDPLQVNIPTKLFFNNIWNGLAYGIGAFVAVGQGRIQTTLDYGNNWSSFTVSNVASITYSHDLETFVAISNTFTNGSYTSQDAITWTQNGNLPNVPSASTAIAYGNGLYVAVLQGDSNVLYSHDGVYWSVTTSGTVASSWKSIIYTKEKFIVSSNDGSSMTSSNGINWTYTGPNVFPSGRFNRISYANGLFFATSNYQAPWLITSADGNIWTTQTVPLGAVSDVTYENGLFVAVCSSGVMTSPDAINWTVQTTPAVPSQGWRHVIYGNGIFVATSRDYIMTSPDGINWTLNTEFGAFDISYGTPGGSPLFVVVEEYSLIYTSPDGINWTNRATPDGEWWAIAYGNGLFVVAGFYGPPNIMTSPDGINWTIPSTPVFPTGAGPVAYGNGVFVVLSYFNFFNPEAILAMSSPDGINWTAQTTPESGWDAITGGWDDITYGNGRFIAVRAYLNKAMFSEDVISWSFLPINIVFIAYGNDIFVGISTNGQLFNSKDGTTWNSGKLSESISGWKSVVYGNGYFMAVGTSETAVVYSTDGINWSADITGSVTDNWNTVAFGNNVFLTLPASGATTMTAQIVETF